MGSNLFLPRARGKNFLTYVHSFHVSIRYRDLNSSLVTYSSLHYGLPFNCLSSPCVVSKCESVESMFVWESSNQYDRLLREEFSQTQSTHCERPFLTGIYNCYFIPLYKRSYGLTLKFLYKRKVKSLPIILLSHILMSIINEYSEIQPNN